MSKLQSEILTGLLIYNPNFIVSSILLLLILIFLHKCLMFGRQYKNLKYPPSPPKLPIIGNLHQLIGKLPHRSFHALSEKYGPLMLLHMGQAPTLVVSSAEIVEEIVRHHDIVSANRPSTTAVNSLLYGCADFAFAPYGEHWRKGRQICHSHLLSNTRIESFRLVREEEVTSLINRIRSLALASPDGSSSNCVNLSEMLFASSYAILSRCIFGKKKGKAKEGDNGKFGQLSRRYASLLIQVSIGDLFPFMGWLDTVTGLTRRMKAAFDEMDAFLDSMIEEQRTLIDDTGLGPNQKERNFVQILLHLQKEGDQLGFTEDKLKAILLDMFEGGVQGSTVTIIWAMAELMKNPAIMKKAQEEVRRVVGRKGRVEQNDINQMEYLKCIVKETLRLHPAAPTMAPREISARIKIRGYDILPKTKLFVNVWAIQRDPKLWDKPQVFIPERFENNPIDFIGQDFEFIPFGVGRRGCPGTSFAVTLIEFAIANLLYWFDWKLAGDNITDHQTLDMTETFGLSSGKKFPLQLVPIVYCP